MNLYDIKFVVDLTSAFEVNKYLQNGWLLLKTYTVSYDPDIAKDDLTLHYVLGATSTVDYSKELDKLNAYSNIPLIKVTDDEITFENLEDEPLPF